MNIYKAIYSENGKSMMGSVEIAVCWADHIRVTTPTPPHKKNKKTKTKNRWLCATYELEHINWTIISSCCAPIYIVVNDIVEYWSLAKLKDTRIMSYLQNSLTKKKTNNFKLSTTTPKTLYEKKDSGSNRLLFDMLKSFYKLVKKVPCHFWKSRYFRNYLIHI